jgi:hypothetical protein
MGLHVSTSLKVTSLEASDTIHGDAEAGFMEVLSEVSALKESDTELAQFQHILNHMHFVYVGSHVFNL